MTLSQPQQTELTDLLESLCLDTLTATQSRRLQERAAESAEVRDFYVDYLQIHASLQWLCRDRDEDASAALPPTVGEPPDRSAQSMLTFLGDSLAPFARPHITSRVIAILVVVGLVGYFAGLSIMVAIHRNAGPASSQPSNVGSLIAGQDAVWCRPDRVPADRAALTNQRYELASGRTQISLAGGATVVIEGPANWQIESDQRLLFDAGKLVASVPRQAVGFTIVTPSAEVIDLGTEFGVVVTDAGDTDLHVIQGRVELRPGREKTIPAGQGQIVKAGQAVRVTTGTVVSTQIPFRRAPFEAARAALPNLPAAARFSHAPFPHDEPIWLGNLFDDRPGTPLTEAMRTDTFRAVADVAGLGVQRVLVGGDPVKLIAPGIEFDLGGLGWQNVHESGPVNDAWTDKPGLWSDKDEGGGIRTLGQPIGLNEPKIEEAIGMHANSLVTFDLDAIRAAGELDGQSLVFRSDRAGVSDTAARSLKSSIHLAAIVSTTERVQSAVVDGQPAQVGQVSNIWSIVSEIGDAIRADGKFVSFSVSIPPDARWLTLVSSGAGDGHFGDHGVWSGARLEVAP